MADRFVRRVGGYLPLLRLDRKAANAALKWSGLVGPRDGKRAVGGWDEDPVTMAVEASRRALISDAAPDSIVFASTSAPFFERLHAGILVDALALPRTTSSQDVGGSRRCGASALTHALEGSGNCLVAAAEKRQTKPGNATQLLYGDGAAACLVGDSGGARLLGNFTLSHDLVDVYASREHPTPYAAEERFVRETSVSEILAPAVGAVCKQAGVAPQAIAVAAVTEPVPGSYKALAAQVGLAAANVAADVALQAGELGAAHSLFALALAFAQAKPGDLVLLAAFGSGCDALLFEMIDEVEGAQQVATALREGQLLSDYARFLSLSGCLDLDWGPRAEVEQKVAAPVLERYGRDIIGFVGGRDGRGNVQFPKSPIPVSPTAAGPEPLSDVRLADVPARIVSLTSDRLNYTPDPPFLFGLVQFENGARVMMEFTDAAPESLSVGDPVTMRFRVKAFDRKRGFRTYFWKAAPVGRPLLGE